MLITIKLKFCSVFALHYSRSQADFFCGQPWPEASVVLWNGRIRFLEWWGSHKKRYFSRYDMVQNPGMAGSDIRDTAGKKRSRRTQYCVKSVQIWTFFWSVFSRIRTENGKIRTRKNSVFGHFSRSAGNCKTSCFSSKCNYIQKHCIKIPNRFNKTNI